VLALVLSTGVWAQASSRQSVPPEQGAQETSQLPESVRRVEQQTGGEVLRAEPMQHDGREVYRLKVLTSDGRVRVMQDDPQQRRGSPRQDNSRLDNSRQDSQRQNTQRQDSSRRESKQRPESRRSPPRGGSGQGDEPPPEF
jgi:hypothetical protein